MNILSLFDGISCGQVALQRAGIVVDNYYASEIDKYAIQITQKNFPNTIQLGDVTQIDFSKLSNIDMIIGGSPCQDLSKAKIDGLGLDGSQSKLFYEYVKALEIIKPTYFLLENVKMKKEYEDIITNLLKVDPIEIDSSLLSCQNRTRIYWTNIPNIVQPIDKNITINDIIYDDNYKVFTDERINISKVKTPNYVKWDLSGKKHYSQQDRAYYKNGKMCTIPKCRAITKTNIVIDYDKGVFRRLHPIEAERCQTLPDNYTKINKISDNMRLDILGNAWVVDVIAHIFKHIDEDYMKKERLKIKEQNEIDNVFKKVE